MMKKLLLTLPLIYSFSVADNIRPLLQVAYDAGGDELVTIEHNYEPDYTIHAGDGLSLEAGMAIDNPMSNFELQFLVGYKFDSDSAANGDIDWTIVPLTALALVKSHGWKFGGGITYHMDPHLKGRFTGYDVNGDYFEDRANDQYDNAIGAVAQIQYNPVDMFAIGLRATFIEYELKDNPSITADATSIGIVGTFKFGGTDYRYR